MRICLCVRWWSPRVQYTHWHVYIYLYTRVCLSLSLYMNACTHTHTPRTKLHSTMHIYVFTRMRVVDFCMNVHMHKHICACTCTHVHAQVHVYSLSVHLFAQTCAPDLSAHIPTFQGWSGWRVSGLPAASAVQSAEDWSRRTCLACWFWTVRHAEVLACLC